MVGPELDVDVRVDDVFKGSGEALLTTGAVVYEELVGDSLVTCWDTGSPVCDDAVLSIPRLFCSGEG
jgi:hypothetical protein